MIQCAIVDDDRDMRQALIGMIGEFGRKNGESYVFSEFSDGEELLQGSWQSCDLLFLDIEMQKLGGMETARQIRQTDPDIPIIFVTQMAQYAVEGYRVDALDFLVKPVDSFQIDLVLRKALRYLQRTGGRAITLQLKGEVRRVPVSEILSVEVMGHYLYYRTDGEILRTKGTMDEAETQLAGQGFVRCSRFALINLRYAEAVDKDAVTVGGQKVPLSRSKRREVMQSIAAYQGGTWK